MSEKTRVRIKRATKARKNIRNLQIKAGNLGKKLLRMCISLSNNHANVQIIETDRFGKTSNVVLSASSKEKDIRDKIGHTGNVAAAKLVGEKIGKLAKDAGIEHIAFDRSGYRYHGRVKALADAAREAGLEF